MRRYFAICALSAFAQAIPSDKQLLDPAWINEGRRQYRLACGGCHGNGGEGGRGPNLADGASVKRAKNERLFGAIKNGVPGTDMPGFNWDDEKTWQMVAFLRSLSAPAMQAIVPGDVENGRAIFHGRGQCSGCHMIRGGGGFIGPDLTDAGATRTVKQLREGIVAPSDRIAEGFQTVKTVAVNGTKLNGVVKNRNNYSLQILDEGGKLHLIDAASLREINLELKSLMPGDYKTKLSAKEIDDLVAYLARQSVRAEAKW